MLERSEKVKLIWLANDEFGDSSRYPLNVSVDQNLVEDLTAESALKYVATASAATLNQTYTETCSASSALVNRVISNQPQTGLMPRDKRRRGKIKQYFKEHQYDCMAFLCFHIVSAVGYKTFRNVSTDRLKKILGNDYLLLLNQGRSCGLIDWEHRPTPYNSEENPNHYNLISVKGRRGSFQRVHLANGIAEERIRRLNNKDVNAFNGAILLKTYNSIQNCFLDDLQMDVTNSALIGGHFVPTIDGYGNRCHNHLVNLNKEYRSKIKWRSDSTTPTGELDLANSHAFFLFHLFHHQHLIDYAVTDSKTRLNLKKAFDIPYNKWVMNKALTSLKSGRFLEDFFIPMMDECDPYWRGSTKQMMIATKALKEQDMVDDRTLGKMAFMYIINDGAKHLLKKIADVPIYSFIAYTIVELQCITIAPIDIRGVKDYESRKNTSLILQRIESRFMQETYLRSGINWGFLIHDSVFTLESEFHLVRKAMVDVARWMNIPTPFSKSKTYS